MSGEEARREVEELTQEELLGLLGKDDRKLLQELAEEFLKELAEEAGVPKEELRIFIVEKRGSPELARKIMAVLDA